MRLLGIGLADVSSSDGWGQGDLLDAHAHRSRKVEEAVAELRRRHEDLALTRASLLRRPAHGPPGRERGDQG